MCVFTLFWVWYSKFFLYKCFLICDLVHSISYFVKFYYVFYICTVYEYTAFPCDLMWLQLSFAFDWNISMFCVCVCVRTLQWDSIWEFWVLVGYLRAVQRDWFTTVASKASLCVVWWWSNSLSHQPFLLFVWLLLFREYTTIIWVYYNLLSK